MRTLHIGLRVGELDRSLEFYTGLGYEIVGTVAESPIGHLTMLKLPGDSFVTIELVHDPRNGDTVATGLTHVVVQVESMPATVAALARNGVDAEPPTSPDGTDDFLTASVVDPDGTRIELVQWPAGHAPGFTSADFTT